MSIIRLCPAYERNGKLDEIHKSPILAEIFRGQSDKAHYLMLYLQIKRIIDFRIDGDFAELGVKAGVSAKFIHGCAQEKKIRLFDTFEGFDGRDTSDLPERHKNVFKNVPQLEEVATYLNADDVQDVILS